MVSIHFAESHFAESHFADSHFAESHFAESHFAESRLCIVAPVVDGLIEGLSSRPNHDSLLELEYLLLKNY